MDHCHRHHRTSRYHISLVVHRPYVSNRVKLINMSQGQRARYETSKKDKEMWEIYWYYKLLFGTKNPPLPREHAKAFKEGDRRMINELYISNK